MGLARKIWKSPKVGLFLVNHAQSNFYNEIPIHANLDFHQKIGFSQICSNGYMRAKQVPQANESSAVYANQAVSEASKSGAIFANQAKQKLSKQVASNQPTNQLSK